MTLKAELKNRFTEPRVHLFGTSFSAVVSGTGLREAWCAYVFMTERNFLPPPPRPAPIYDWPSVFDDDIKFAFYCLISTDLQIDTFPMKLTAG